tara:strand:- start:1741 stop:1893 length:153 start_codon:yes stop_codon:yes gene_type:complete
MDVRLSTSEALSENNLRETLSQLTITFVAARRLTSAIGPTEPMKIPNALL